METKSIETTTTTTTTTTVANSTNRTTTTRNTTTTTNTTSTKGNPKTGDNTPVGGLLSVMAVSLFSTVSTLRKKRK